MPVLVFIDSTRKPNSKNTICKAEMPAMKDYGCKHIKLMDVLAAPEGIARIEREHPDVEVYVAGLDDHLNEHGYIVPGLGDAGDRIFGTK